MFILAKGKKKVKIICPVTKIKKWKENGIVLGMKWNSVLSHSFFMFLLMQLKCCYNIVPCVTSKLFLKT